MTTRSVFYQECPVCGRTLRIAVKYFGRKVDCVHCGGQFLAIEPASRERQPGPQAALPREAGVTAPLHLGALPVVET